MLSTIRRVAIVGAVALAPLAFATVTTPGTAGAIECGYGTVFDPPSNTCVALPPPPAPAPPPPAWNGDITPYFSVGACIPIPVPFAPSICAGI